MWPNADPKLAWLDKIFQGLDSQQGILGNVCAGLELLTYLVGKLKKEQMLAAIKIMIRGILSCCSCSNMRVIRLVNPLLHKIFTTFGIEELDELINRVGRFVQDSLASHERGAQGSGQTLYPALMVLRAVAQYTTHHLDRLMAPIMKVLQRLTRDHIQPGNQDYNSG